jgi:vacuolar protein sorting-associated protein 35
LIFGGLSLAGDVRAREDAGEKIKYKTKKCFQFVHEIGMALASNAPPLALRLFLQSAARADALRCDKIAYEFVAQSFLMYEEMADSTKQLRALQEIVGTLYVCTGFSAEDTQNLVTRTTKYSAQLLKKPDQCRMIQMCCHLFWTAEKRFEKPYADASRVLECLQRSLKIADVCMGTSTHVRLFVEILNAYVYFFHYGCPSIKVKFLSGLVQLINANMSSMDDAGGAEEIRTYYRNTVAHLESMKKEEAFQEKLAALKL